MQVNVNIDHTCCAMHRVISAKKELMENTVTGETHGTK